MIILFGTVLMMTGCCFRSAILCNELAAATRVEPVMHYPYHSGFIDVTTTTIDYY